MKKRLACFLVAGLLAGCSVESVKPDLNSNEPDINVEVEPIVFEPRTVIASYINIEAERLNIRSDADLDGEKVGAVYKNEKYQIISKKYDAQKRLWYQIETGEGSIGYVAGWFCAETEIVIRVEEEDTKITEINVLPIPRYLENPFDKNAALVGDQVVGLIIKELTQVEELHKIVFTGDVELTGTYYHEESKLETGKVVRFVPDEASSVLLPRIGDNISTVWFIANDYELISTKFGEMGSSGYAKVTIDLYTIGYGTTGAYNQAKIKEVTIE